MDQSRNIIFLDEHGVIVSHNAMIANSYVDDQDRKTHEQMADPVAVNMINNIAILMNAQFVSSSSLRRNYRTRDSFIDHLDSMGIDSSRLAQHWQICATKELRLERTARIEQYLRNHADCIDSYLILDDITDLRDSFNSVVTPDSKEGFQLKDYNEALKVLGIPLELTSSQAFKSNAPVWERYPDMAMKPPSS